MRTALTLLMLLTVVATADADNGRRGRWRGTTHRHWRAFDGYHIGNPGWDSSYYSPYTPNNTISTDTPLGTPTPIVGEWQSDGTVPNAIPNTPWTGGTPTYSTPTPNATEPTTTQKYPAAPGIRLEKSSIFSNTNASGAPSSRTYRPAQHPIQSQPKDYWNTIDGAGR